VPATECSRISAQLLAEEVAVLPFHQRRCAVGESLTSLADNLLDRGLGAELKGLFRQNSTPAKYRRQTT
jgi:hypothetical protein